MRLSKEQSRQRWNELRDLWNEFDPIGVMDVPDWPRDEYESYVGPTMRLLERDAAIEEIVECLEWAVCERMGLELNREDAMSFAHGAKDWFQERWQGTTV